MTKRARLIQAYRQTPWRQQTQTIGLFSAVVVFVTLVAGVYLNVTARAATFGREVQYMQAEKRELEQKIEDLETRLAYLSSSQEMESRARKLGFQPIMKNQIIYVVVPGYSDRQPAELAPLPQQGAHQFTALPPEFTMSLLDWVSDVIYQLSVQTGGLTP
ncbi:MAG: septum formation initiator family protein [Anaerolineae bacterium]|nr:septum formation initiator family protein [Anaerolineae bacterium]